MTRQTFPTRFDDTTVEVSVLESRAFLYVDMAGTTTAVMLNREQASDIAFALLGLPDRDTPSEPMYMQDAPALSDDDAPPITEEDEGYTYSDYESDLDYVQYTDLYEPRYEDDEDDSAFGRGYRMGDQVGFERGYAQAVDDFRHGLWADEVNVLVMQAYNDGRNAE